MVLLGLDFTAKAEVPLKVDFVYEGHEGARSLGGAWLLACVRDRTYRTDRTYPGWLSWDFWLAGTSSPYLLGV